MDLAKYKYKTNINTATKTTKTHTNTNANTNGCTAYIHLKLGYLVEGKQDVLQDSVTNWA